MVVGVLTQHLQDRAGLGGHGVGRDVDLADPVEPGQRHDDLAARRIGRTGADETGIAALRHDRGARLGCQREDARNLVGGRGTKHETGASGKQPAQFVHIGVYVVRVAERMRVPDDRRKAAQKRTVWKHRLVRCRHGTA